jgi:hypothetical protein
MKIKPPKPPKCAYKKCRKEFEKKASNHVMCSYECALADIRDKKEKQAEKEWKVRKKVGKEKLKTYTQKVNDVKEIFQLWVRLRDKHLPCISCGATYSNPCWDGGHYKKAEKYRGIIFHIYNCHKQCRQCNFFMDGNESNYRERLVIKIGEQNVKELEALAIETKDKKYSDDELSGIAENYKKLTKELMKDVMF